MSPRRRRSRRPTFKVEDVPALAAFARAYLHQDVLVEHGSAAGAFRAFHAEASEDERRRLDEDLRRLAGAAAAGRWPGARLARFFRDQLGAAWAPESAAELATLAENSRRA